MKVINVLIDMIAVFDKEGNVRPWRFRIEEEESLRTVDVQKVVKKDLLKIAGKLYTSYTCQSIINNMEKIYEIRYDKKEMKWYLYKI